MSGEVAGHRARLTDVGVTAFVRLELDFPSILELISTSERGVDCL